METAVPLNRNSFPSNLRITDIRGCTMVNEPFHYPVIRIDTNQDVYGLGEAFTHASLGNVLVFKKMLIGKNPLDIQGILRGLRRFAHSDTGAAGSYGLAPAYSAIDIALHDLAGKVYGVPVWRLLGSKVRDRARIYCDTVESEDPAEYGRRLLARKKAGYTFFKMDLLTQMVANKPQAIYDNGAATDRGLGFLCEYIDAVRDAIGWDVPLAADHFGDLSLKDCIRYARAFEPYQLSWAEDFLDYHDWHSYQMLSAATTTPICTGEYGFGLKEDFRPLIDNRAIDIIHPDITVCGGLLEMRQIAEYADLNGIPVAIHACNSPVAQAAAVHAASIMPNFLALEFHQEDCPWWGKTVEGDTPPITDAHGFMPVSDSPGLGVELNEEVVKQHLLAPGYFEPTDMYDSGIVGIRWIAKQEG